MLFFGRSLIKSSASLNRLVWKGAGFAVPAFSIVRTQLANQGTAIRKWRDFEINVSVLFFPPH